MKSCHTNVLIFNSPKIGFEKLNTSNSSAQNVDYEFTSYFHFQQMGLHVKTGQLWVNIQLS